MRESTKSQNPGKEVFSTEETLASVDRDPELLREVVGMFMKECPEVVTAIRKAIDERNPPALNRSAHTLKGMVANFGAHAAMETALKLEMMGKNSDYAGVEETFAALEEELNRLSKGLNQFIGDA